MNARIRDWLVLLVLALVVNGVVAGLVAVPGYMDADYYFSGGQIIASGGEWVEPYLWNYVSAWPSLPAPAFGYWQPLPSILAAAGILAFPFLDPFDAAQIPFVLMAAALPVITYQVALHIGERRHALIAGLLMVFSGYFVVRWSLPETFTPFAVAGSAALALTGWGRAGSKWWGWALAGVSAGLAHLTRADGLLLILVIGFMAFLFRRDRSMVGRVIDAGAGIAGYALMMSPWWVRNVAVFGSTQAPGGLSALWLVHYNDLFTYPPDLSPARYFAEGWGAILRSKYDALIVNLATYIGVVNLVFLTPFTLIGVWRRWRHDWLLPALVYGAALFGAMTFAFSQVGARGGWFHSAGALMPFVLPAAVLGIDDSVRWLARRRAGWRAADAQRFFGGAAVVFAAAITIYLVLVQIAGLPLRGSIAWNGSDDAYVELGSILDERGVPDDAPVMVKNPPGFYVHAGRGGVPLPNGDEAMLLRAADDYDAQYVIVDQDVADPLRSLFEEGPSTHHRLRLVETLGSGDSAVFLYEILPADE